MGEDRLFSLEFMIIHHEFEVNIDKVVEEFEKRISVALSQEAYCAPLITTK